ncbi:hypothetical protein ABIF62_006344 [Bradyrhizobium japonicum]
MSRFSAASATALTLAGPAVEPGLDLAALEAELGGDHDLVAEWLKRLAEQLFIGERAVGLGGVEEGHTARDGGPDQRDRLRRLGRRAIAVAQAHAAEAEGRDLEAALAQFSHLHRQLSLEFMFGGEFRPRAGLRLDDKSGMY